MSDVGKNICSSIIFRHDQLALDIYW